MYLRECACTFGAGPIPASLRTWCGPAARRAATSFAGSTARIVSGAQFHDGAWCTFVSARAPSVPARFRPPCGLGASPQLDVRRLHSPGRRLESYRGRRSPRPRRTTKTPVVTVALLGAVQRVGRLRDATDRDALGRRGLGAAKTDGVGAAVTEHRACRSSSRSAACSSGTTNSNSTRAHERASTAVAVRRRARRVCSKTNADANGPNQPQASCVSPIAQPQPASLGG